MVDPASTPPGTDAEQRIRAAWERADWQGAATIAISEYGPELLRFAAVMLRSIDDAHEAFADACERIWTGLPGFRFECSFRTWAFVVIRRACLDHLRGARRRRLHAGETGELSEVEARVRTRTAAHLRTEVKDRFKELRDALSLEEQILLSLRVDQGLAWSEIARVVQDDDAEIDGLQRKQREAALRKQFERLKERLRELARARGLLDEP